MVRTQIYIPKNTHERLTHLARGINEPIAKIVRDFLEEALAKMPMDYSGKKALKAIAGLKLKGGPKDLSKNIDHYLYGKPEK
jgi:predicted DNA-binding protein